MTPTWKMESNCASNFHEKLKKGRPFQLLETHSGPQVHQKKSALNEKSKCGGASCSQVHNMINP